MKYFILSVTVIFILSTHSALENTHALDANCSDGLCLQITIPNSSVKSGENIVGTGKAFAQNSQAINIGTLTLDFTPPADKDPTNMEFISVQESDHSYQISFDTYPVVENVSLIPGSYTATFTITTDDGTSASQDVVITVDSATASKTDSQKMGYGFDKLLFLLFLYYVPALSIERILEIPNLSHRFSRHHEINILKDHIASLSKLRDKKFVENSSYKITLSDLSKPNIGNSTGKHSELTGHSDSVSLELVNNALNKASHELLHQQALQRFLFWIVAVAIASIPGFFIATAGIGPTQIMNDLVEPPITPELISPESIDVFINMLFIGSGSKPIHDLINLIPKVRPKQSS